MYVIGLITQFNFEWLVVLDCTSMEDTTMQAKNLPLKVKFKHNIDTRKFKIYSLDKRYIFAILLFYTNFVLKKKKKCTVQFSLQ